MPSDIGLKTVSAKDFFLQANHRLNGSSGLGVRQAPGGRPAIPTTSSQVASGVWLGQWFQQVVQQKTEGELEMAAGSSVGITVVQRSHGERIYYEAMVAEEVLYILEDNERWATSVKLVLIVFT